MGNDVRPPSQPILVLGKLRRVMDAVAGDPAGLTSRQVQQATGLPTSTTIRLLQNLAAEGFLDVDDGRYVVGLRVLRWAHTRRVDSRLAERAQPELNLLRDQTGETAVLFVRQGLQRVLVALAETRHEVVRLVSLGQVMPLHAGSAGKVFLAFGEQARELALAAPLPAWTPATITDPARLRRHCAAIRDRGWAESVAERDSGTASISAPIYDHAGRLAAAIGIGVPQQRFTEDKRVRWAGAVAAAARRLSAGLGHDQNSTAG
ncbi:IclR family transcriptional regulator [Qaidamihabitans albus]|uniref:IclR family transcriptional regulator n=1 Tax=Qaidamihabitans albus TaxID=2795733 RepID=UPI0018F14305|nr:IclR family transcriptional regulator [Qaidamihabitans albus]